MIAERLHESMNKFTRMSGFFMTSYVFYMLACTQDWNGLYHEPWVDGIKVYEYYPQLQEQSYAKNFMRWNDIFTGRLVYKLQGNTNKRLTTEAMKFIGIYGSYFIQFPLFTYIRVGGFQGEPLRLP